jgi:hypothetical protein
VGDREQDGVGRRDRDYDWHSLPPHIPNAVRAGAGGDSAGAAPTPIRAAAHGELACPRLCCGGRVKRRSLLSGWFSSGRSGWLRFQEWLACGLEVSGCSSRLFALWWRSRGSVGGGALEVTRFSSEARRAGIARDALTAFGQPSPGSEAHDVGRGSATSERSSPLRGWLRRSSRRARSRTGCRRAFEPAR